MERVKGIEPSYPAWKAGALADVLHPHRKPARGMQASAWRQEFKERGESFFITFYKYYTKKFYKNQLFSYKPFDIFFIGFFLGPK